MRAKLSAFLLLGLLAGATWASVSAKLPGFADKAPVVVSSNACRSFGQDKCCSSTDCCPDDQCCPSGECCLDCCDPDCCELCCPAVSSTARPEASSSPSCCKSSCSLK